MAKKPIKYRNFESHHKQRNYTVFYFYAKEHADQFESLLLQHEIPFERGEGKDMLRRHLFGVHKLHQEKAEILNDEVGNQFRRPFLGEKSFRNFVLFITFAAILLAIIGYILARKG